jgi:hypothetical protein
MVNIPGHSTPRFVIRHEVMPDWTSITHRRSNACVGVVYQPAAKTLPTTPLVVPFSFRESVIAKCKVETQCFQVDIQSGKGSIRFLSESLNAEYDVQLLSIRIHSWRRWKQITSQISPHILLHIATKMFFSVDVRLVGRDAVWTCRWAPTFRRNMLPPSSGRQNTKDQHRHLHRRENLKFYTFLIKFTNLS